MNQSWVFAALLIFTISANAEVTLTVEKKVSTIETVKDFNKAVASNGGLLDRNAETEFSSAADFEGYLVKMYSSDEKGKSSVVIKVKLREPDLWARLTVQKHDELLIAGRLCESLKKMGYDDVGGTPLSCEVK